ncbi:hypothetical protein B0G71_7972 [Paraburkholderia sp. BL27I4N3]|nr:hypothetical protein B0G71_7972 [Paraburkholderia sp. BL27I4N3]
MRDGEDLDAILTWRVTRKVSDSLTVLNDLMIWLPEDTPATRRLIGRYIDVWEYPDGRIELRAGGVALPCVPYDKLAEIDQGAVVEHKRLGPVLQVAQAMQAQRDNRRVSGSPSRTNRGAAVRKPVTLPGTKKARAFTQAELNETILQLATQTRQTAKASLKTRPPVRKGSLNGLIRLASSYAVLQHCMELKPVKREPTQPLRSDISN